MLGLTALLLVAIGASCYVVIEVLHWEGVAQTFGIAAGVLPALAFVLWRLSKWPWLEPAHRGARGIDPAVAAAHARRQAERQAAIERRVAELRADPRRECFWPLVQRGVLLTDAEIDTKLARIAELEAVPHRRPYVSTVLQGQTLTDAQIDYLADPAALTTCAHLQPIERALRAEGVSLRLVHVGAAAGGRQFAWELLRQRFELAACVAQVDRLVNPRDDEYDHRLVCGQCRSELVGEAHGSPWPA